MLSTPISLFIEIYVDPFVCTGCGTCVDQCSMGVFEMQKMIAEPVRGDSCIGCFLCKNFCPTGSDPDPLGHEGVMDVRICRCRILTILNKGRTNVKRII